MCGDSICPGASSAEWGVVKLATLTDASGVVATRHALPSWRRSTAGAWFSSAPAAWYGRRRHREHAAPVGLWHRRQSVHPRRLIASPRTQLLNKTVSVSAGGDTQDRIDQGRLRRLPRLVLRSARQRRTGQHRSPRPRSASWCSRPTNPLRVACSSQSYLYAVRSRERRSASAAGLCCGRNSVVGQIAGQQPGVAARHRRSADRQRTIDHPQVGHHADTSRLPVSPGGKVKKVGWKEIFR